MPVESIKDSFITDNILNHDCILNDAESQELKELGSIVEELTEAFNVKVDENERDHVYDRVMDIIELVFSAGMTYQSAMASATVPLNLSQESAGRLLELLIGGAESS